MRRSWKIWILCLCLIACGGAAILWRNHESKVDAEKLARDARIQLQQAMQGDPRAQAELGSMYSHGLGVPQDFNEALKWRRKSADQGNVDGEDGLAFMYLNGQAVQQDYAEALRWYRKAADQGDAKAEFNIGNMYSNAQGVPKDDVEAALWFRRSASQGDRAAEYSLGLLTFYGHGVPQNRVEAYIWFRKAADQGDEYATHFLGESLTLPRKIFLWIKLVIGVLLTFSFLSLNSFEPNSSFRDPGQSAKTATGILFLLSAGLSSYGYTHHLIRSLAFGFNGFTWLKWLLDGVLIAAVSYFVLREKKAVRQLEWSRRVPE